MASAGSHIQRVIAWIRAVIDRYRALHGRATAAAITLYGFLALFPIAVLAIAVLGFVSSNNHHVAQDIVKDLGVKGDAARTVVRAVAKARESRHLATVVGTVGVLWVGSSFALSVANAYDTAWGVSRSATRDRVVGLVWLAGAGVLIVVASFATAGVAALPIELAPIVVAASLAFDTALWLWTAWVLPKRRVRLRALVPAALVGAVGLEAMKVVGGYAVPTLVTGSSALYGTIGVVFALLTWLLVLGRLVVVVTVVEVLGSERGQGWSRTMRQPPPSRR